MKVLRFPEKWSQDSIDERRLADLAQEAAWSQFEEARRRRIWEAQEREIQRRVEDWRAKKRREELVAWWSLVVFVGALLILGLRGMLP